MEPEKYIPILRAEVLGGCADGQITVETLADLPKLDSFLREAGRFNNAGLRKSAGLPPHWRNEELYMLTL